MFFFLQCDNTVNKFTTKVKLLLVDHTAMWT